MPAGEDYGYEQAYERQNGGDYGGVYHGDVDIDLNASSDRSPREESTHEFDEVTLTCTWPSEERNRAPGKASRTAWSTVEDKSVLTQFAQGNDPVYVIFPPTVTVNGRTRSSTPECWSYTTLQDAFGFEGWSNQEKLKSARIVPSLDTQHLWEQDLKDEKTRRERKLSRCELSYWVKAPNAVQAIPNYQPFLARCLLPREQVWYMDASNQTWKRGLIDESSPNHCAQEVASTGENLVIRPVVPPGTPTSTSTPTPTTLQVPFANVVPYYAPCIPELIQRVQPLIALRQAQQAEQARQAKAHLAAVIARANAADPKKAVQQLSVADLFHLAETVYNWSLKTSETTHRFELSAPFKLLFATNQLYLRGYCSGVSAASTPCFASATLAPGDYQVPVPPTRITKIVQIGLSKLQLGYEQQLERRWDDLRYQNGHLTQQGVEELDAARGEERRAFTPPTYELQVEGKLAGGENTLTGLHSDYQLLVSTGNKEWPTEDEIRRASVESFQQRQRADQARIDEYVASEWQKGVDARAR